MNTITNFQPMEFNFEGEFLGFAEPSHKYKYVRLKVLAEELQIKVAKELRPLVKLTLQPGDRLQVMGLVKLNHDTQQLKLKANRILPLVDCRAALQPPEPSCAQANVAKPCQPKPCKPTVKVRVCQKSKCLKRGGKSLCASLEAALRDWQLHDQVAIEPTGCLGRCSSAPNLMITPGKHLHSGICVKTLPKFERIISRMLTGSGDHP